MEFLIKQFLIGKNMCTIKTFRSSHLKCSIKNAVPKIFGCYRKKLGLESLFDKVADLKKNYYKKKTPTQVYCEYCKIFRVACVVNLKLIFTD